MPSSPTDQGAMERVVGEDRKETGSEVDRVPAGDSLASDRQSRGHVRDPSDGHELVVVVIGRTGGHDPPSEDGPMRHLHGKAEVQSLVPPDRSGTRRIRSARVTTAEHHEACDAQNQEGNSHCDRFDFSPRIVLPTDAVITAGCRSRGTKPSPPIACGVSAEFVDNQHGTAGSHLPAKAYGGRLPAWGSSQSLVDTVPLHGAFSR
jgi:hypothetical protein